MVYIYGMIGNGLYMDWSHSNNSELRIKKKKVFLKNRVTDDVCLNM